MEHTVSRFRRFLLSWIDSNELAWMPPWPVGGTAREREVQELRRQACRLIRQDLVATQGRPRILTQSLAWPAVATLKTFRGLSSRSVRFASRPWLREFATMWWLQIFHNLRIADQFEYSLDTAARRKLVRSFLSCSEQQILLTRAAEIHHGFPALDQKQNFARFCEINRLPHPSTVVEFNDGRLLQNHPWPPSDLVLKPTNRYCGSGVEIITHEAATATWRTSSGISLTSENLPAYALEKLNGDPWLLQSRLVNPPAWKFFTHGPLSTVRIVTGIVSPGGRPVLVGMQARCSIHHPFVDNVGAGGLSSSVDPDTGRLNIGLTWNGGSRYNPTHPVTGCQIEGVLLPDWTALRDLALRAHAAAGSWSSMGWDVASTQNGPMLIEANILWGAMSFIPQGHMPFVEVMKTVFGPDYSKLRR